MNKVVKVSMIGFGIVAALLIVAILVFASTFDINDYKDRIAQAVHDETGRTLRFDGDLSLTYFPALGVKLGGMNLSNAEGFGQKPMLQVVSAIVSVKVLPLLKGEVKFGHLELDQLSLNLSRDEGGVSNWDDIVGRVKKEAVQEHDEQDGKKFSLEIEGITVKNANLNWDDKVEEMKFILRGIDLTTGKIYKGAPFPVEANLDFECNKPNVRGAVTLSGKSSIDFESREYGHMDMSLSVIAEGDDIPGGKGNADVGLKFLVLDFNKEHGQITGLTVSSYGATVHLDGSFEGITQGLKKMAATVTVDPMDVKATMANLGLDVPETADSAALTKVGGMVDYVFNPGQIHVKTLQADVDGTRIVGNGRVKRGETEPFYFARLDVGTLDLDRYLPPEHKQNVQASKEAVASGEKSDRFLPTELLRRLYLDIEANIAELKVEGARLEKVKGMLKARHGLVRISPLSANAYGGTLSAGATINAMGKYPKSDIIIGIDKLDVGGLSKDVTGTSEYGGIANINGAISCDGERVPVMLRSMNGKVSFHLANGIFPGVDLIRMAKDTHDNKDEKDGKVEASDTDSTRFGSIAGTGVITSGILRNRDLEVKAPGLRADGHGSVVLPTKQIDYLLKVKLTPTAGGQGGKSYDEHYGVMVPIRVAGTLEDPRYWVSVSEYVKALGGAVIGTAGSVLGGVKSAIKGVGQAIDESCCEDTAPKGEEPKKRKRFLGIF